MKLSSLIILPLLLLSAPSFAQEQSEYERMYNKCIKAADGINNSVVAECSGLTSEKAKSEINQRYRTIHARIFAKNPKDAKKFEASQKAWLQYRDIHCDLSGAYIGTPMYGYCPMKLNSSRALELRALDRD